MKLSSLLQPPIEIIEADLFSPSSELIKRWDDGNLSSDEKQLLEQNPLAQDYQKNFEISSDQGEEEPIDGEIQMPSFLTSLIDRQFKAKQAFRSIKSFEAGQVRLISSLPDNSLSKTDKKLAVLLVDPIESDENKWRGFMVGSETSWASYWDMLLEENEDGAFDPIAGMIQIWNTIIVSTDNLGSVVAQLSVTRMASVRAMEHEYLFGDELDPNQAKPGRVYGRETVDGISVLTGTPLSDNDPRHRYQQLYHTVAKVVSVPALVFVEEQEKVSFLDKFVNQFQSVSEQIGASISSQAEVAYAMGDEDSHSGGKTYHYHDCLALNFIQKNELLFIRAKTIKPIESILLLKDGEDIIEEVKVTSDYCPAIRFDPREMISLILQCEGLNDLKIDFPLTI